MAGPIVIVGGGTAGSTVALQLASLTTRPIVVCESGDISSTDDEPRFFDVLGRSQYTTEETVQVGARALSYLQARVVGGGSAINGMLLTGEEPTYVDGLTHIPHEDDLGDISRALLTSGGRVSRLWWNNGRWNPGRALIHLVEEGRVEWKKCNVERIHHCDGAVSGVGTATETIDTDCVVMCAGAIATPRLLLRSELLAVNPHIGKGYQDHPAITFSLQRRTGNMGTFDAAAVKDITLETGVRGLMIAYERQDSSIDSVALVSILLMNPESRGAVLYEDDHLIVATNLLSTTRDRDGMRKLVRATVDVLQNEQFQDVSHSIVGGTTGTSLTTLTEMSDSELDDWIAAEVAPVSHASSSMSHSVDSRGRVHGCAGIVVADASVLSHVPHETPAAAVTIEAHRIGRLLGEDLA